MRGLRDNPDIFIPDTFWAFPLFKMMKDIPAFRSFLTSINMKDDGLALSGYKFLVREIVGRYMLDFERETFLGLTEDDETQRAFFVGIDYDKTSSTSEKANAVRNVKKMLQAMKKSKNMRSLEASMNTLYERFFMPLQNIFNESIDLDKSINGDKESILTIISLSRFFDPVMRGMETEPEIDIFAGMEIVSPPDHAQEERLAKVNKKWELQFPGYKAGLAFILRRVLDDEKLITDIVSAKDERALVQAMRSAEKRIDEILKQKTSRGIPFGKFFTIKNKADKEKLGELIHKSSIRDLTLNERIDQLLLWYQFEVIDSATTRLFSGGSTFRSLVRGEIAERRDHGVKEKMDVIRFVHHEDVPFFSYAVLIERFGTFSDFSGWLIFMEVGGDYSGMGGFEYTSTEQMLEPNKDSINIREFEISQQQLRDYFTAKQPGEVAQLRFRVDDLEKQKAEAVGRLLEFITKLHYDLLGYKTEINFKDSRLLQDREIDVLATHAGKKELIVVECSTNIPVDINKLVEEINGKAAAIRQKSEFNKFTEMVKVFVTTDNSVRGLRSGEEIVQRLVEAGIQVSGIENIIKNLPKRLRRETLLPLFESKKNWLDIDDDITQYFRRNNY